MSEARIENTFHRSFDFSPKAAPYDPVKPRFHLAEVQDEAATASAGRPIFRSVERVEIIIPGSFNTPVKNVTDEHRSRWPTEYAKFKAGQEVAVEGTPIDEWAALNRAQVHELKALNIFTVEQCAALDDNAIKRIGMGGMSIRNAAKAYLDDAESMKMVTQMTRELEMRDAEIARLKVAVEAQNAAISQMQAAMASGNHPAAVAHAIAAAPVVPEAPAPSSLDSLAKPRRGRPPRQMVEEDV